jgi:hypothetical protein
MSGARQPVPGSRVTSPTPSEFTGRPDVDGAATRDPAFRPSRPAGAAGAPQGPANVQVIAAVNTLGSRT